MADEARLQAIRDYWASTAGTGTDAERVANIAAKAQQVGVSLDEVSQAFGADAAAGAKFFQQYGVQPWSPPAAQTAPPAPQPALEQFVAIRAADQAANPPPPPTPAAAATPQYGSPERLAAIKDYWASTKGTDQQRIADIVAKAKSVGVPMSEIAQAFGANAADGAKFFQQYGVTPWGADGRDVAPTAPVAQQPAPAAQQPTPVTPATPVATAQQPAPEASGTARGGPAPLPQQPGRQPGGEGYPIEGGGGYQYQPIAPNGGAGVRYRTAGLDNPWSTSNIYGPLNRPTQQQPYRPQYPQYTMQQATPGAQPTLAGPTQARQPQY